MRVHHATLHVVSATVPQRRRAAPFVAMVAAALLCLLAAAFGRGGVAFANTGASFHATTPARIVDTRDGTGGIARVQGGSSIEVQVAGRGGIPSDASAAALNITVTDPSESGWLTAWPAGEPRPLASNVNFAPGATVANLAVVRLGAGGRVNLFLSNGDAHVIIDAQGWFPAGGGFNAGTPTRVVDTRDRAISAPEQDLVVPIAGRAGVPAGARAVVVNLTVTEPSAAGYLTARPSGTAQPLASNLNFAAGDTTANLAIIGLGSDGAVVVRSSSAAAHVIVDVLGWFASDSGVGAQVPSRVMDTRAGSPMGGGATIRLPVAGRGGTPGTGLRAVMLNVTLTEPSGAPWLVAFPSGRSRPLASTVNGGSGRTVANLAMLDVGLDGAVELYLSSGGAHVIVDVLGWVSDTASPPAATTPTSSPSPTTTTRPATTQPPTTAPPTTAPPTTAPPTTASAGLTAEQASFLAAINTARATGRSCGIHGFMAAVPALRWDSRLATAAQLHSQDQYNTANMSHTGSDGSNAGQRITRQGYTWRTYGENVAWNYSTLSAVMTGWLGSDGHCKNIMSAAFRDIGMARVGTSPSQSPGIYWTQNFATLQ